MIFFRKVLNLLSSNQRLKLFLLFFMVLVMALLEVVSLASILPFLSVATDPTQIQVNEWLNWIYTTLGFTTTDGFLLALAGTALTALVVSNIWIATTLFVEYRFAISVCHGLSVRLLRHYLSQPYSFFLGRNSADFSKNILGETDAIRPVFIASLEFSSKVIVTLAITVMLIVYDPLLALTVIVTFGVLYGIIYAIVNKRLFRLGEERVDTNKQRFQLASEALGAIKDVKLFGFERNFLERFVEPSRRFNACLANAVVTGKLPRYGLEVLAFGSVLVIAIYFLLRGEGLQRTIPVLGFYAFAGYRLMPNLQQVFLSYTTLRFGAPAVDNLYNELVSKTSASKQNAHTVSSHLDSEDAKKTVLPLNRELVFEDITFTYPGASRPTFKDLSLSIDAKSTIGIVGTTGAGKTTLVDIVLGLLQPEEGQILVDGVPLTSDNMRTWQNGLGYVPQQIFLTDDTIARNIAFGISQDEIDQDAVETAARIAKIHDFVIDELPEGYGTFVGERGIRLSGGQRQRIGIARALYHNPAVLVFDEATSALDNETEAAVMEAINELVGSRTILIIAHRLATLDACDRLLRVQDGRVVSGGPGR